MADTLNGTFEIPDFDLYYADIPGQYIDDILKSDLPGSHLDQLIYGDLPGSHLNVVLEAPLPGGSTDELLSMPIRTKLSGEARRTHDRFPEAHRSESRTYAEGDRYDGFPEPTGTMPAPKIRTNPAQKKKNNLEPDTLWGTIRNNIRESRAAAVSTPFTRARNSSKYVQKEIRKEKPRRKMGVLGAFFVMMFLLSMLSRVIVPIVRHITSLQGGGGQQTVTDDGHLYLTDAEFDSLVNIWENTLGDDSREDFELSNDEFIEKYESNGFEMNFNEETGTASGTRADGTTWVNVYRNEDYVSYSCQTSSNQLDLNVVEKSFSGAAPEYVCDNLGRDISDIGLDQEMLDKFVNSTDDSGYVSYYTENFSIYYYDYDDTYDFYLYGEDGQSYMSIDKENYYLSMVTIWN